MSKPTGRPTGRPRNTGRSRVGERHGSLKVIESAGYDDKLRDSLWLVLCDCGAMRVMRSKWFGHDSTCGLGCVKRGTKPFDADKSLVMAKASEYRRSAKRRKLLWLLTNEQVRYLLFAQCAYCGIEPALGIDRVNSLHGYWISNCVPCCKICNRAKLDMSMLDFRNWIIKVFENVCNWPTPESFQGSPLDPIQMRISSRSGSVTDTK